MNTAQNQRSPLKDAPLRNPGQSLDEEIQRLWDDKVAPYLVVTLALFFFTVMEWWRWYLNLPPRPWLFTGLFAVAVLYFLFKLIPVRRQVRQLRQARDGEKAVGQYLEALRARGYTIFHDLVDKSFNVDHLLIGPAGVFTVETKTISKPEKGPTEVHYNGKQIIVGGFQPDRNPLVQGKAQAHWIRQLLQETTGKPFPVRALVLYPGWFVKTTARGYLDVVVLNPKQLSGFLEKFEVKLSPEDIRLASYHLSRHIRVAAKTLKQA